MLQKTYCIFEINSTLLNFLFILFFFCVYIYMYVRTYKCILFCPALANDDI